VDKDEVIRIDNPEVLSPEQRITELQTQLEELRGGKFNSNTLVELIKNPQAIRQKFNLDDRQTRNVKALLVAGGAGASVKYLGDSIGDELAAVGGALLSAYIARKIFG
jgi:hypothetical protein